MRILLTGLSAACLLTACSLPKVGPVIPPSSTIAAAPAAQGKFLGSADPVFAAEEVPPDWWHLYESPELDRLVQSALAANTDLRAAVANLARAQAGLEHAEAAAGPNTTISAAPGFGRRSAEEELRPGRPLPNNWVYGLGGTVSYQVDLFGQVARSLDAAQADLGAATAARDAVRVSVVAETTRAYLAACSARREIRIGEHSVQLQARSTALVQRLAGVGRGTDIEVSRASAQEEQLQAALPALHARQRLALYRLAVLTGLPPSEFSIDADRCAQEPRVSKLLPIGDGASLLRRRPDIRRAAFELQSAGARIGVAVADLYPRISLGASLGSVGLMKNFADADTFKFSLGPLISWQFPDRSRARSRIHAAEAEQQYALARFDGAVLTALQETEGALEVYARRLQQKARLERSLQHAMHVSEDSERLFGMGRTGYLPVLDAHRSLAAISQALAATDSQLAADQVNLFLALGGGWQETPPTTTPKTSP